MSTLAELRNQSFLTQDDLAKRAGVGQSTIAKIEQGESRPRHKTARALAEALGVEPGAIDWPAGNGKGAGDSTAG
ncbi:MAG TPA: helix-turn-helix transcriptional regulator [Chloroflexota bacterium]